MILSRLTAPACTAVSASRSFGQVAVFTPGIQSLIINFGNSVFFPVGLLYRPWLVLRVVKRSFSLNYS